MRRLVPLFALAAVALAIFTARPAAANLVTACTALDLCYCVNTDYSETITANVARVRQLLASQKAQGKAIGYLSIPLSGAGGGSYEVNKAVAKDVVDHVTARFGAKSVWLLNPGDEGSDKMTGASGADYMYMWTQILAGSKGLGEDFDFFYFTGPTDFGKYFELTGKGDLEALDVWFDQHIAKEPLKKSIDQGETTKPRFRNYYGLRASVAFSLGSHDEWNIARLINMRRRGAADFGISEQLAIFFDGRPQSPGAYELVTATGDAGRCVK